MQRACCRRPIPTTRELIRAQLVGNDAWAIAGYRATYHCWRAAGMDAEADTVAATFMEYEQAFRSALAATERKARCAAVVARRWNRLGQPRGRLPVPRAAGVGSAPRRPRPPLLAPTGGAGIGYYRNADSLHSYVAADLGTWALLAGERAVADSVLDAALRWRSASGGARRGVHALGPRLRHQLPAAPDRRRGTGHAGPELAPLRRRRDAAAHARARCASVVRAPRIARAPTRWGRIDLAFERTRHGRELAMDSGAGVDRADAAPRRPGRHRGAAAAARAAPRRGAGAAGDVRGGKVECAARGTGAPRSSAQASAAH
jgi:hypothetical protein